MWGKELATRPSFIEKKLWTFEEANESPVKIKNGTILLDHKVLSIQKRFLGNQLNVRSEHRTTEEQLEGNINGQRRLINGAKRLEHRTDKGSYNREH